MAHPPSICIVIPYFGQWPFWMPLFLESCRHNPSIDWLLLSDCGTPENCPDNVRIVPTGFAEYCQRVAQTLGIHFQPASAYKLCDLKPALGDIHAAELGAYDFWGFGDIDLVYGDLRAYFTPERLAGKLFLATHKRRISGHLSLLRNTAEMRLAYRCVPGWQQMLAQPEHMAFDEKPFSKLFLRHKNSPLLQWWSKRFDPWLRQAEFEEAYTTPNARIPWQDGSENYPQTWYWKAGKVSNDFAPRTQYPYFHFMNWKKAWPQQGQELDISSMANGVAISAQGFRAL